MLCDLHAHTTFSDGTLTPAQLVENAIRCGLSAVALTDHNTFDGLTDFAAAAEDAGIEAVPGIEIPTSFGDVEYHVIALFVESSQYDCFRGVIEGEKQRSARSKRELVDRLRHRGYDIDYDRICEKNRNPNINRTHIAAEMVGKGYVSSVREAMRTLLSGRNGLYTAPEHIGTPELFRLIRQAGAVSVLAHPLFSTTAENVRLLLDHAASDGPDAMEVIYSEYDDSATREAFAIAEEYGLSFSGGSDFHGSNKPHIQLGCGTGALAVPYEWYEKLKLIHDQRMAEIFP